MYRDSSSRKCLGNIYHIVSFPNTTFFHKYEMLINKEFKIT